MRRRVAISEAIGSLLVVRVSLLLSILVDEVRLLACHGIVNRVNAWLCSHDRSDNWLYVLLRLLLVHSHIWRDWRGGELLLLHLVAHLAKIQTLELLSGSLDIDELLL